MPRSVIVLSTDAAFFEHVRTRLGDDHRFTDSGDALHCDGSLAPLTTIYPVANPATDWTDWNTDGPLADPASMSAIIIETRSPHWIAELGVLIDSVTAAPVFAVDAADAMWPAAQIDPARWRLPEPLSPATSGCHGRTIRDVAHSQSMRSCSRRIFSPNASLTRSA